MKLIIFFIANINFKSWAKSFKSSRKSKSFTICRKEKSKDLHFTRKDERFPETFIGHLKVLDTSTFTRKIKEYERNKKKEKEKEKEELNKIMEKIQK